MLSVIIKDDGEANVTKLTYENLWRELKGMPDVELIVAKDWLGALDKVENKYVCFVESDCLVSSGYFSSQLGLFKKNPDFRRLAMLSSAVAVNNWAVKFYGYSAGQGYVEPTKNKKSRYVYPVQVGYVPGAIINVLMLREILSDIQQVRYDDLIELSTIISFGFWRKGDGHRVHINPNTTYVTTEEYTNELGDLDLDTSDLKDLFKREVI